MRGQKCTCKIIYIHILCHVFKRRLTAMSHTLRILPVEVVLGLLPVGLFPQRYADTHPPVIWTDKNRCRQIEISGGRVVDGQKTEGA